MKLVGHPRLQNNFDFRSRTRDRGTKGRLRVFSVLVATKSHYKAVGPDRLRIFHLANEATVLIVGRELMLKDMQRRL